MASAVPKLTPYFALSNLDVLPAPPWAAGPRRVSGPVSLLMRYEARRPDAEPAAKTKWPAGLRPNALVGSWRRRASFSRCKPVKRRLRAMSDQFEGGSLCGAVRFVATGQPESVAWCHCQSCRKHSGAPVSVFAAFKRAAYVVTKGEVTKFNSSPGRWRGFCARCGSTLTCESKRLPTETHFHVGAFDQAARLQPTRHIFPDERLPWLHLADA